MIDDDGISDHHHHPHPHDRHHHHPSMEYDRAAFFASYEALSDEQKQELWARATATGASSHSKLPLSVDIRAAGRGTGMALIALSLSQQGHWEGCLNVND